MKMLLKSAVLLAVALTGTAQANTDGPATPWDVESVRHGLIEVGVAYELTENCASASANKFKGLAFLLSLNSDARRAGFSKAEVKAFVENPANEARLETIVWNRLYRHGAVKGDETSVCTAAVSEAHSNTQASKLFRIKD
jgi:hypothetical protein